MFVVRKADDDRTPEESLSDLEREVAKIIQQGITDAEKGALTPPVKDAIASRNYEAIVDAFPWDTVNSSLDLTKGALADATKSKIGTGFPKVGFKGRFDYTDPRSIEWATQQSARLVTAVTDEMRSQIRDVIGQAFTQNRTVVDTAKQLRTFIGLNGRQQNSLEKFIEANAGKPNLDKLVADYKARAIKYRATMIARTEIITAEANGRMLGWQQAIDSGWSSPNSVKRWSAALSERTCDICGAMNGKSVQWDKPFPNGVYDAPAHVMCRCSTVLLEPDSELAQDFMAADTVSVVAPPREDMPDKLTGAIAGLRSASDAVTAAHARSGSVSTFQYDSTAVENLNIDVQAVEFNGVSSTELTFKLTPDGLKAVEKEAKSVAGKKNWRTDKDISVIDFKTEKGQLTFADVPPDGSQSFQKLLRNRAVGEFAWEIQGTGHATYTRFLPDGSAIRVIASAKRGYAYHGTTRVIITGKPTPAQIDNVLSKLFASARPSTQADVDLLKANRILSIFQPANKEMKIADFATKKKYIEETLGKYWGFKWDEVETALTTEGRINFLLPKSVARKIMKDTGVVQIQHSLGHSIHGATQDETIRNIIAKFTKPDDVLLPTTSRWTRGVNFMGQSSEKDILTGGADYVFARPLHYAPQGQMSMYRYHYDPEEMFRRLDWFAYAEDSYGVRNPAANSFFKGASSFTEPNWFGELMGSQPGAEIMFQGGIDMNKVTMFPVSVRLQRDLFEALNKLDIYEINGIPVDEFFPVL